MQRKLALLRLAATAELRNPGLRMLGLIALLGSGLFAWSEGDLAAPTAVVLTAWLGRAFGTAACLWFAYAAIRDQGAGLGAVLRSKPVDGAGWVLLSLLAGLATWLLLTGLAFLGAALGQLAAAGPLSLAAHGYAFLRTVPLVASVGTLSFLLSRMLRSPLGGIIVLFAWFCAMAGLSYVPVYLRPDYSQNLLLFAGAAVLLFLLAGPVVERFRRGELRRAENVVLPALAVPAMCLATGFGAVRAYEATPEAQVQRSTMWPQLEQQDLRLGTRAPGFWLPDGRGGTVRSAAYQGKVLLIYLFSPHDLETARTLPALEVMAHEYGGRGVQPIAIALSEDQGDGAALALAGGYHFPIASDPTTAAASPEAKSSLATAYRASTLPALIVTDRQRRVRGIFTNVVYDTDRLRQMVNERLAAEPE